MSVNFESRKRISSKRRHANFHMPADTKNSPIRQISQIPYRSFVAMSKEDELTMEYLELNIKISSETVTIVAIYLPKELIELAIYFLIGINYQVAGHKGINCTTFVLEGFRILIWILEANEKQNDALIPEWAVFFNYSQILVTSTPLLESLNRMELPQNIFGMQQSLLLVTQSDNTPLEDIIQQKFWSHDFILEKDIVLPDNERGSRLGLKIVEAIQSSLKHNWHYSNSITSQLSLYLINRLLKPSNATPQETVRSAFLNFQKDTVAEYLQHLQRHTIPTDELELRSAIEANKRIFFLSVRKHLTCFSSNFPAKRGPIDSSFCKDMEQQVMNSLTSFSSIKQSQLCSSNRELATKFNENILQQLSETYFSTGIEEDSEGGLRQLENNLRNVMEEYGRKSIKVTTQLKSFNNFMARHKTAFMEQINRAVKASKKLSLGERDELNDRIEIQSGMLETLQTQVKDLQQQRQGIEAKNFEIKKRIFEMNSMKGKSEYTIVQSTRDRRKQALSSRPLNQFRPTANLSAESPRRKVSKKCCCVLI